MAAPRWLDADELDAWRGFTLMQLQLTAALGRELAADGLSYADYVVLAGLSDHEANRARVVEFGRVLGWEKSRLSHHLTRMEQRGLVRRTKCPTDQRGAFVELTDVGRDAIAAAAPGHVAAVRRTFVDLLARDELRTLSAIAAKVLAGLAADCDALDPCTDA